MVFLIVSADKPLCTYLTAQLKKHFGELSVVLCALDNFNASKFIVSHSPSVIIFDFRTPGPGIFNLVRHFLPGAERLFFLIQAAQNIALKAIQNGILGLYDIPSQIKILIQDIHRHVNVNLTQSIERKMFELRNMLGLNQKILICQDSGFCELFVNEIVYLQQSERGLRIVLLHKIMDLKHLDIEAMEAQLSGNQFCRFGKSLVVNLNRMEKLVRLAEGCRLCC